MKEKITSEEASFLIESLKTVFDNKEEIKQFLENNFELSNDAVLVYAKEQLNLLRNNDEAVLNEFIDPISLGILGGAAALSIALTHVVGIVHRNAVTERYKNKIAKYMSPQDAKKFESLALQARAIRKSDPEQYKRLLKQIDILVKKVDALEQKSK